MTQSSHDSDWLIVIEHDLGGRWALSLLKTCSALRKARGHQGLAAHRVPERQILVLNGRKPDKRWLRQSLGRNRTLLFRPSGSGTAQAIYHALTLACAENPQAFVVVCPSNRLHCLDDEMGPIRVARELKNRLVLLGTLDESLHVNECLIQTGGFVGRIEGQNVWMVNQFLNQREEVIRASTGVYCSTSIVAAHCQTLLDLGWRRFPGLMRVLEEHQSKAKCNEPCEALESNLGDESSPLNFMSDLVGSFPWQTVMIEHWNRIRPARALSAGAQPLFTTLNRNPLFLH